MFDLTADRLLSVRDVAAIAGVHERTVAVWLTKGLASVRIGGTRRIPLSALERFIQHGQDASR